MNKWTLSNRKALVTGGTKGIGKATVNELAVLDATVLFIAKDEKQVKETESNFRNAGLKVTGLAADITNTKDVALLKAWIMENWSSLDILVNNAGINIRKSSEDFSPQEYDKIIGTNVNAPFQLANTLLPLLRNSINAAIVNVASVAGILDVQTGAPYGISKAGLLQMTRNLAVEWAKHKIRVNAVSPWFTETPLTEPLLSNAEKLAHIVHRTPLGRIAKAEEIAAAIAFLVMPAASYITGQNIIVDGGMSVNSL